MTARLHAQRLPMIFFPQDKPYTLNCHYYPTLIFSSLTHNSLLGQVRLTSPSIYDVATEGPGRQPPQRICFVMCSRIFQIEYSLSISLAISFNLDECSLTKYANIYAVLSFIFSSSLVFDLSKYSSNSVIGYSSNS